MLVQNRDFRASYYFDSEVDDQIFKNFRDFLDDDDDNELRPWGVCP